MFFRVRAFLAFALSLMTMGGSLPCFAGPEKDGVETLGHFHHILFDMRGSRGGNGDVSAGFLIAQDFLERFKFRGKMKFLVEKKEMQILRVLTGESLEFGDSLFNDQVTVVNLKQLRESALKSPIDMYVALARPDEKLTGKKALKISFSPDAVFWRQTVFGSTENYKEPFGHIRFRDRTYPMQSSGIGEGEAGYYYDTVAASLRDKTPQQVRKFILAELGKHPDSVSGKILDPLLRGKVLRGAQLGLAYGLSSISQKDEFADYLTGLMEKAQEEQISIALVVPTPIRLEDIHKDLGSYDSSQLQWHEATTSSEDLPAIAQPGQVHVLQTRSVSHSVFVGLQALSDLPYVVAGDNALSAALILGKPFTMTVVPWNARNVENLANALQQMPETQRIGDIRPLVIDASVLSAVRTAKAAGEFDISIDRYPKKQVFLRASELSRFQPAYKKLMTRFPFLTDRVLDSISSIIGQNSAPQDPILRLELNEAQLLKGQSESVDLVLRILGSEASDSVKKSLIQKLLSSDITDARAVKAISTVVTDLLMKDYEQTNFRRNLNYLHLKPDTPANRPVLKSVIDRLIQVSREPMQMESALDLLRDLSDGDASAVGRAMEIFEERFLRGERVVSKDNLKTAYFILNGGISQAERIESPYVSRLIEMTQQTRDRVLQEELISILATAWTDRSREALYDLFETGDVEVRATVAHNVTHFMSGGKKKRAYEAAVFFFSKIISDPSPTVRTGHYLMVEDFLLNHTVRFKGNRRGVVPREILNALATPGEGRSAAYKFSRIIEVQPVQFDGVVITPNDACDSLLIAASEE